MAASPDEQMGFEPEGPQSRDKGAQDNNLPKVLFVNCMI